MWRAADILYEIVALTTPLLAAQPKFSYDTPTDKEPHTIVFIKLNISNARENSHIK